MKKLMITVFCLLLLTGVNPAYSEDILTKQRPFVEISSPTEWSFHKYIEQPIGLYRGALSIDIPIYTIKDGETEIPLVLRYNTSGIKVAEEAGWVGLGWNLDVGGYITCNIVDGYDWRDDTYESRYKAMFYPENHGYVHTHGGQVETPEMWNYMLYMSQLSDHYHWGKLSPDVYYYSYPGGAGRYVIDYRDNSIVQLQREKAIIINNGSVNEEFAPKTITTTTGICHKYDYFGKNTMHGESIPLTVTYALTQSAYPSGATINYSYSTLEYRDTVYSCSMTGMLPQNNGEIDASGYSNYSMAMPDMSFIDKKESLITSIQTENYCIEFVTGPREDHSVLRKLETINIKNSQNGPVLKKYTFTYGYFCPDGNTVNAHQQKRLKLLSVQAVSVTDASLAEQYTFNYNETSLPAKNSLAVDHWGYANNTSGANRGTILPDLTGLYGLYYQDDDFNAWNGHLLPKYSPDHDYRYCSGGLLSEVHYPDGGKTVFSFESNSFWGKKIASLGESPQPQYYTQTIMDRNNANDTRTCFISPTDTTYVTITYELSRGLNSWADMYGSKIRIPYTSCPNCQPEDLLNFDNMCYQMFVSGSTEQSIRGSLSLVRLPGVTTFGVDIPDALGDQYGSNLNHAYLSATVQYSNTRPQDYNVDTLSYGCGMRIKEVDHYEAGAISPKSIRRYDYTDPITGHTSGTLFDYPKYAEQYERVGYSYRESNVQQFPYVDTPRQFCLYDRPMEANPYGWHGGVGYAYVKETIVGVGGYTSYRFLNTAVQDVDHSYRVGAPSNGKLIEKTIVDSNNNDVFKEINEYATVYSKYYYGVNLINTWNKYPNLIKVGYGLWASAIYDAYTPAYYPFFHIILEYALNQADVLLTKQIQAQDGVIKETRWRYNYTTLLPQSETIINSDSKVIEKRITYPTDYNDLSNSILKSKNIIEKPVEVSFYVDSVLIKTGYTEYNDCGFPETRYSTGSDSSALFDIKEYEVIEEDVRGNPLCYTVGETYDEVYIWGYKWRYPVARITGSTYSEVKTALGVSYLKSLSAQDAPNISQLNALRTMLQGAQIWTWTYDGLGNILSETGPDGLKTIFTYDGFGRLISKGRLSGSVVQTQEEYCYADDKIEHITWSNASGSQKFKDITFSNGLGLREQILRTNYTSSGGTLVESIGYDSALRETLNMLPYSTGDNSELKQSNTSTQAWTYWHSKYPNDGNYSNKIKYENNALGRITGQYNPGNAYYYGDKGVKSVYRSNNTNEVLRLTVIDSGDLYNSGYYPASELYTTEYTDEDGVKRVEYKDKLDYLVLSRRFVGEDCADTYYVRDNKYNLRLVITPKGSTGITGMGLYAETHPSIAKLSYMYEYDGRNRMVEKANQGTGAEYYIYDKANRVVAHQTAGDRNNGVWRTFVLDGNGRMVEETRMMLGLSRLEFQSSYEELIGTGTVVRSNRYGGYSTNPQSQFVAVPGVVTSMDVNNSITARLTEETLSEVAAGENTNPTYYTRRHFYDYLGREVQNVITIGNHTIRISIKYDYRDNVISTVEIIDGDTKYESLSYDARGRKITESTVIPGSTPFIMSVQYEYDDLGKIVSRSYGNGVVESIDYNLQGWRITQEVNRSGECLFREALKYYDVGTNATPSFAGRLTGRAVMNNGSYYYEYYSYDALGRLLGGGKESNISYDLNGNILGLTRSLTGTTPSQMTWSYDGNKRHGYYYDNEGNIVSLNNVNSISYNWLGLPSSVVFGSAVMNYKYLSDGTKLSCTDNANTGYVYLGSRRYNKNSQSLILESIASSGGRISKNSTGSYLANYYTCDYLGNVRIVTDGGGNVLFKSDYTPFGMPYNVSGVSPDYTLSSKERQSLGGFIDFGARFYYPGGALWLRQDPQTDNNTEVSPYAYCANNPLLYVDPSGNIWETVWDVISLTTGVKSFSDNVKEGNTGAAILDGLGVLADAAAVVMPFVPGGVSNVIKGARALNKGYDSARVARIANSAMPEQCKRGLITETLLLAEKGFKKNTEKFVTFAKGEYLGVVPDIFDKQKGIIGEIKDVSKLGDLKQIEGEINLAQQKGYRFILFVEKDAKLSPKLLDTIKSYPKASIKTFSRDELWKMLE